MATVIQFSWENLQPYLCATRICGDGKHSRILLMLIPIKASRQVNSYFYQCFKQLSHILMWEIEMLPTWEELVIVGGAFFLELQRLVASIHAAVQCAKWTCRTFLRGYPWSKLHGTKIVDGWTQASSAFLVWKCVKWLKFALFLQLTGQRYDVFAVVYPWIRTVLNCTSLVDSVDNSHVKAA